MSHEDNFIKNLEKLASNEDNTKKYVISAYRLYAAFGKISNDDFLSLIDLFLFKKNDPDLMKYLRKDKKEIKHKKVTIKDFEPLINDFSAVTNSLKIIASRPNGKEILNAVEKVYFEQSGHTYTRGDISNRVVSASLQIPASERQIYYWLKEARVIFCNERGLRL